MAQSSWPNTAGGRQISDVQWEQMASGFAPDGIIGSPADTPVVYADSTGLQLKVRAGKLGLLRGRGWTSGPAEFTKTVSPNSSGAVRTDLAVLRLTRSTWEVSLEVKAGSPGAGAPALTQDPVSTGTGVYEIAVAKATIVNGAVTLAATDVVDLARYLSTNSAASSASRPKLLRDRSGPPGSWSNTAAPTSDLQTATGTISSFRTTYDKVSPDTNLEATMQLSGWLGLPGRVYAGVRISATGFTSANYVVATHYFNYPTGLGTGLSPALSGASPSQHNHQVLLPAMHHSFGNTEHITGLSARTYTVQAFIYTSGPTFAMDANDECSLRLAEV